MFRKIKRNLVLLAVFTSGLLAVSPTSAQSVFKQVDHGGSVICGVRDNGAATCNSAVKIDARTPADLPPVEQIAAGSTAVCAVLESGDLQCFGSTAFGLTNPPTQGAPYKSVDISGSHACAINWVDAIECWGLDSNNRLDAPAGQFAQLSLARQQACAVDFNGAVACWGSNDQGTTDVPLNLPPATKTVAGFASSCALLEDGSIQCWGRDVGKLNGTYVDFDLVAANSLRFGQTGLCAIDTEGSFDCRYSTFNGESMGVRTDLAVPQGIGNSDISLTGFSNGCYIDIIGDIDCFGAETQTQAPSLGNVNMASTTTGLEAAVYSQTTIELSWDSPRDAFNVAGHEISRNGEVAVFTQNASSFLFADLEPGITETFAVRRVDVSGDVGPFSDSVSVTGGSPEQPPSTVSYTPPSRLLNTDDALAIVFCSDVAEIFWFADTDTDIIDGYEVHRDGQFVAFTELDFYDDSGATPGVSHNYDIIAIDLQEPTRFHGVASALLDLTDADSEICNPDF